MKLHEVRHYLIDRCLDLGKLEQAAHQYAAEVIGLQEQDITEMAEELYEGAPTIRL
jgi:hypothetical protein